MVDGVGCPTYVVLGIVMAAVYVSFGSTLRVSRLGDADTNHYQDARIGLNLLSRELGCLLGGSEHLFEGKDNEFEFFAVTQSLDVEEGEGARVLWIRYYLSNWKLYRQEAVVKAPLPLAGMMAKDKEKALGRVKLGSKKRYQIAENVRGFDVEYLWVPPQEQERPREVPPKWMEPVVMDRNEKGWGLPQGIRVTLTLRRPDDKRASNEFVLSKAFRPRPPYNEKAIDKAEKGS